MKDYASRHSCRTCIWMDQCEDELPCDFYDAGHYEIVDLTDEQLEVLIEAGRLEFRKECGDCYGERSCKDA